MSHPSTLVYLACPYTHPDPRVRVDRFLTVSRVAGSLMRQGMHVFSPITHSHPIAEMVEMPWEWEFWEDQDKAFLRQCSRLIVLQLPGWEASRGVNAEIKIAESLGIPVEYMPHTLEPRRD
jgi:hypothetical protein